MFNNFSDFTIVKIWINHLTDIFFSEDIRQNTICLDKSNFIEIPKLVSTFYIHHETKRIRRLENHNTKALSMWIGKEGIYFTE